MFAYEAVLSHHPSCIRCQLAIQNRLKDLCECFQVTDSLSFDLWFDFGHPSNDSTNGYQSTQESPSYLHDCTICCILMGKSVSRIARLTKEMVRKMILSGLQGIIAFAPLVKNHVDNLILVADIFCRIRHKLVYNFKANISTIAYPGHKFGQRVFMPLSVEKHPKRWNKPHSENIFQVNICCS